MVGFSIEIFIRNAESLDVVIWFWLIKIDKMKQMKLKGKNKVEIVLFPFQ